MRIPRGEPVLPRTPILTTYPPVHGSIKLHTKDEAILKRIEEKLDRLLKALEKEKP